MQRPSGFTVLELLVTLAVLAVLLGLGIPAFRASLERQRISGAVFLVAAQFATARHAAITRREVVTLCPSAGGTECDETMDWSHGWLMYGGRHRASQPEAPQAVLRRFPPPGHATLRFHSSAGRRALHFLPDGRSAGSNLRLRICLAGQLRGEVVVNNLGRVRSRRLPGWQACEG
ncbi:GspH/FimT family pseudopilin [Stenotrophomonas sp. HITSZ_GD]|uniref:GspH/FimT family pseudopilin n=1 Tax=Stenotrophomonas sp. HITSZ_GD TaxID=3037248 RepID=UPI00240E8591|nr:GspH/FimT family pseudopilin [Stenotrophomonas sp. HITSZ_GD]MDG2524574.1 GspH/FimT family pseudopilin [Stenotrophomonas sp. HITSZ_GD]